MTTDAAQPTPNVGQSVRRRVDMKFLTGKGRYADDIKLPGALPGDPPVAPCTRPHHRRGPVGN